MLKKFAAITIVVLLVVLSGCAKDTGMGASEIENDSNKLVFTSTQSSASIDPANGYSGWFTLRYGVGETLFKLDDSMKPQPWLADGYELIDDNTWEIVIKEGISFHNGAEMTAEKVKTSLERLIEINDRAPSTLRIESITAEGNMLTIKTDVPNPTLINGLCDPFACIIDVDAKTDFDTAVIGTGPYMIESFLPKGNSTVVANKSYWDGEPKLEKVELKPITDGDTMTMALQSGEVDATQGLPYSSHSLFEQNEDYKMSSTSTSRVFMIYYNFANDLLEDPVLREVIDMSIDKENYAKVLLNGSANPAIGAFPSSLPFGGDKITASDYNVDRAAKILDEAGYRDSNNDGIREKDGKDLSFTLVTYTSRVELPILAQAIQSQLKDMGIEIKVEVSEDVTDRLKSGDFDLAAYAYVTSPTGDPLSYLDYVFKTDGVSNFGKYSNQEVDSLIEELRNEFDLQKRYDLAVQIQQKAIDDKAYTFIAHLDMAFVMKKEVQGLEVHPTDYYQINVNTDLVK
ncbi:ABC transporter substrate-binding protein [Alkalibacter mobilis]|uniref:ABC transporter substrate-binding protein n=1 Tax=Alkalibacter mobilis TaxID=2787712 RepID=UPI00189D0A41|nr:ABC transporter substrate-binding protein [Alkalibacter mobilis]MBF7096244.1 ABC transporter substrate-binding protein [Alkalibacter mobilis]